MLIPAYEKIKDTLRAQVQGTCGVYSFYTAVQILRAINPKNPAVPSPKKSESGPTDVPGKSLREYSKRQFKSGQGEILNDSEMSRLIAASGYMPLSFGRAGGAGLDAKKDFLEMCMRENYPVLIAYLADQFGSAVRYTSVAGKGAGAHWSLIIGVTGSSARVVEPNAPGALETWPMADLMISNGKSDQVKFAKYWAKTVKGMPEARRQLQTTVPKGPKVDTFRGIDPIGEDTTGWNPNIKGQIAQVDVYDLGGDTGTRHTDQDLNHVLIAVIPPEK